MPPGRFSPVVDSGRRAELLPVEYFHVVFTVPQPIEAIAYQNEALLYDMLFKAMAQTLRTIAVDPKHLGAQIGFIAVLHTWGQNLLHYPHLHCVVPGGGISPDGKRWISCRPGFFLPVRVLSRLFRRLFLELLRAAFERKALKFFNAMAPLQDALAFEQFLAPAASTEWVVCAKAPF
jgi:Putative transposase